MIMMSRNAVSDPLFQKWKKNVKSLDKVKHFIYYNKVKKCSSKSYVQIERMSSIKDYLLLWTSLIDLLLTLSIQKICWFSIPLFSCRTYNYHAHLSRAIKCHKQPQSEILQPLFLFSTQSLLLKVFLIPVGDISLFFLSNAMGWSIKGNVYSMDFSEKWV